VISVAVILVLDCTEYTKQSTAAAVVVSVGAVPPVKSQLAAICQGPAAGAVLRDPDAATGASRLVGWVSQGAVAAQCHAEVIC
jgi:hypothetical protein